jgi:uroporphyrin-III C-methyltransferase
MSINPNAQPGAGSVTLVGAGPGDPDLLTVKAVKAIRNATVLLVDDLVSQEIVALAAPSARVVRVGKRGGCRSTPQAFIDRLMLRAARAGETVVRLKGGDPLVFGRGGEELERLIHAGIRVDIVNGVTAALAAAGSLGVALTHRELAQGVVFLTGHSQGPERPDWVALGALAASNRLTLAIYMGAGSCQEIQDGLLAHMAANTPAAIVQNTSLPTQREALCTLAELHATLVGKRLGSPCVIVVGDVLQALLLAARQNAPRPDAARQA